MTDIKLISHTGDFSQPDDHSYPCKQVEKSCTYYLGGKIETLADVEARNDPKEGLLRSNMRRNGWDRIITNTNSWKVTQPLNADDVVLDWSNNQRTDA